MPAPCAKSKKPSRATARPARPARPRTLEEAVEELYRMHPKDRKRIGAILRLGTISAAADFLAEDRDTVSASWKRHRLLLADIVGVQPLTAEELL